VYVRILIKVVEMMVVVVMNEAEKDVSDLDLSSL
jgi:hypothetical protein